MAGGKKIRRLVNQGAFPGYLWSVVSLEEVLDDVNAVALTPDQFAHLQEVVMELAMETIPSHPQAGVDVKPISGFWEIREKGAVLGKINVRIFFWYTSERREIVILGMINKSAEGALPRHLVMRIQRRLEIYHGIRGQTS